MVRLEEQTPGCPVQYGKSLFDERLKALIAEDLVSLNFA